MLTNVENINYNAPSRWDRHFRYYMDTYAYEEHFFQMDSSLRQIRDLKEKYIRFNANCAGDERKAADLFLSSIQRSERSGLPTVRPNR